MRHDLNAFDSFIESSLGIKEGHDDKSHALAVLREPREELVALRSAADRPAHCEASGEEGQDGLGADISGGAGD